MHEAVHRLQLAIGSYIHVDHDAVDRARPEARPHEVTGPDLEALGDLVAERPRRAAQAGEDGDLGRAARGHSSGPPLRSGELCQLFAVTARSAAAASPPFR